MKSMKSMYEEYLCVLIYHGASVHSVAQGIY